MKRTFCILLTLIASAETASAITTVYTDRTTWEAAVNGSIAVENFDSLSPQTFPANGVTPAGLVSIETTNAAAFNEIVNGGGLNIDGTTYLRISPDTEIEVVSILFPYPIIAWGADWKESVDADDLHVTFADIVETPIFDLTGSHSGFVGFISDLPFSSVSFTDPFVSYSDAGFDYLSFSAGASIVPEPATATLGLLAFGGLMMRRRRMA
jgi:hypothetical protein